MVFLFCRRPVGRSWARPGCQDYGPIFLADNVLVTPAPVPMKLANPATLPTGEFRFSFTNWPKLSFTAFGATNLALPFSNWTPLGPVPEIAPGQLQFTDSGRPTLRGASTVSLHLEPPPWAVSPSLCIPWRTGRG